MFRLFDGDKVFKELQHSPVRRTHTHTHTFRTTDTYGLNNRARNAKASGLLRVGLPSRLMTLFYCYLLYKYERVAERCSETYCHDLLIAAINVGGVFIMVVCPWIGFYSPGGFN